MAPDVSAIEKLIDEAALARVGQTVRHEAVGLAQGLDAIVDASF